MVYFLVAITTLLLGGIVGWVFTSKRVHARELEIKMLETKNNELAAEIASSKKEAEFLNIALRESKESSEKQVRENREQYEKQLKDAREQSEKNLKEQMEALKLVFKESANRLLEEKSKDLTSYNEKEMKSIIEPLSTKMEEFKKAVEDSKEKSIKNSASIEEQIKSMLEQTNAISKEASNLASALKGSNKMQGNWGEVVLTTLLENMGLKEGDNFVRQNMIRDVDGTPIRHEESDKKLIPDVLLFLPENKSVVIDSKVSLDAYIKYCNAGSDEERSEAEKQHLKSMEAHYRDLSKKNYSQYVKQSGKESLEYVVMFTPNEGAFQLFYQNNKVMWHQAFNQKVIIAGESNLFAMLRIIETSWVQVQQQKNMENIMSTASELLTRVSAFVNIFDGIGKTFDKTMAEYDKAKSKLRGRQSILTTAKKLEDLKVISKESIKELSGEIEEE